jgi:outer membrane protein
MKFVYSSIIALLLTINLFAQEKVVLTLEKAIELAFQNNISVLQANNNVDAASGGLLAAYGSYLPFINASGSWSRTDNQRVGLQYEGVNIPVTSKSTSNYFQTRISAGLTIFDGFQREAKFSKANADMAGSEYNVIRTKQTIRYQIEAAYLNLLRQEQLVKVTEENLKRDQRQLERITESNRVGALSLADVYRQQSQVAADELNVINAQNAYNQDKADLVALIGLDMTKEYQFSDPSISTAIDQSEFNTVKDKYQNSSELVNRALDSRTDYLSAKENYNAARASVTAAWGQYLPNVSASAGYSLSNEKFGNLSDNRSISWGINLSWDIFDRFLTNQTVQSSIVTAKNSEETIKQYERSISVEIQKAKMNLESAQKQVEVSQKGVKSASEDSRIAEERYNLGAGTLLDLLTANAGLVNAQANNINAVYFFITAKRNLEYVLGERTN